MSAHCLELSHLIDSCFNANAVVPYGLTVDQIKSAMTDVYRILNSLNAILYEQVQRRLEDLILGNSLSGIISELVVKSIADRSTTLVRNTKVGGHPDLLPIEFYDSESVLHGEHGIEVKCSIQRGGWQGHNPENAWIMIFRYIVDTETMPLEDREPTRFIQVLLAEIRKEDWSFSGRVGESRRTPTASITKTGMHKLRSNPIYQEPDCVVDPGQYSYDTLYRRLL